MQSDAVLKLAADADVPPSSLSALVARVRALAHRRALWLHALGQSKPPDDSLASLPAALQRALLDLDAPDAEARFFARDARARQLTEAAQRYHTLSMADEDAPLPSIRNALELDDLELDLLAVCVAAEIDPSLAEVFAFVGGDPTRRFVTEPLAVRLCGYGREAASSPVGALAQWELLVAGPAEPGEPPPLRVDPFILGYLRGRTELDPELLAFARAVEPREPLPEWPVDRLRDRIGAALGRGTPTRLVIDGPPSSGRRTLAACVAVGLGAPALAIDTTAIGDAQWPRVHKRAQRQALLHGCALIWHGAQVSRALSGGVAQPPVEVFVTEPPADLGIGAGFHELRVSMPRLGSEQRAHLWRSSLPVIQVFTSEQRRHLAERFAVQVGEIAHVAAQGATAYTEVESLVREVTRGRLGDLGKLLACPFSRDDLQLPERLAAQLDELLFEARERTRFWENEGARRLFPRGTGLIALLSGAPGTGKTMAAQVIAATLGLDLFRIDLAATVSKYIGETAKNLRRLFARAADMSAVLLFDEADALFSKRTEVRDAHDRHANADTNYLLQLVEDYPGIALLATNRRQNMDDAFVRRVRYLLYFPRPEPAQRRAIWHQLVAQLGGPEVAQTLGPDLDRLATTVEATGAQIKNAVLGAAFFAREDGQAIGLDHLRRGLERELGNQGRSLPSDPPTRGRR